MLPGISVARPHWTTDGQGVIAAVYHNAAVQALLYDAATLRRKATVPLPAVALSKDQAH